MTGTAAGPLRITPWERYMALDHGPRHSMTVCSRFWLSRPVDQAAFTAAVAAVTRLNPLLAVRKRGRVWLPVAFDADRQIDWGDAAGPVALRHLPPDDMLAHWTVRVGRLGGLGVADEGLADVHGTLVILRFSHAVADGLAAVAVVRQVCRALAGLPAEAPARSALDERLTLGRTPRADRLRLRHELGRIAHYFASLPAECAPDHGGTPPGATPQIDCERVVASPELTRSLRAGARAALVSLNDVLLAALYRTLAPLMDPRAVIRIAVPTSLRAAGNRAFCNQVSMVFLDRRAAQTADPALLKGVAAEMAHVKRWRLGHAMHSFLGVASRIGGGALRGMVMLRGFTTTAVLSNLGEPGTDVGVEPDDIRILAHDLLPPLRPGTNLAVTAVSHGGRLGLTARFAPERISPVRARAILERVLAEAAAVVAPA